MKVLTRIIYLFLTVLLISCGTKEIFVPTEYQNEYLIFGNGGGFTGAVTTYYLLEDGRVYKEGNIPDSPDLLGEFDKSLVDQLFKSYSNLKFNDLKMDDPGNVYFFISMSSSMQKLTWGGNQQQVPQALTTYHANLTNLVKNLTQQSSKK